MAKPFVIDKRGAFFVVLLGLVTLPGLCFACVLSLLGSLSAGGTWVLAIPALIMAALGTYFALATLRELSGAWSIRIDDDGIHSPKLASGVLAWDQVKRIESLSFGVWRIHGPQSQLRICAYLFESRDKLSRLVKKRGPEQA